MSKKQISMHLNSVTTEDTAIYYNARHTVRDFIASPEKNYPTGTLWNIRSLKDTLTQGQSLQEVLSDA
jgi:hypothetical protein